MTYFLLALTLGCSDYEVRPLDNSEESNWFDEASERYQNALDASDAEMDTGTVNEADEDLSDEVVGDESDSDGRPQGESDERSWDDSEEESGSDEEEGDDGYGGPGWGDPEEEEWGDPDIIPGEARGPFPGEVIVSELMIHPRATDDNVGEWVELRNVGSVWMDLAGYRLADGGVDDTTIASLSEGSLFVAPGEYLILCADSDYWSNGGIECDGTFYYWTMGGGFALSNIGDEVRLLTPEGDLVDEVRYGEGFATEGEAIGVPPSVLSSLLNDDEDEWCNQRTFMSFGDVGTPGTHNDLCW